MGLSRAARNTICTERGENQTFIKSTPGTGNLHENQKVIIL